MSLLTNLNNFSQNSSKYLATKIPVPEILIFVDSNPDQITNYISDFNRAIALYNQYRVDLQFPHREYFINALELSQKFNHDLPLFDKVVPSEEVYELLGTDEYFREVWTVRPISHLLVNLLLLIYRTTILLENKSTLMGNGRQLVQISSTIEEMVYFLHHSGDPLSIYPAFKIWYDNWKEEGFDGRLFYLSV